LAESVKMCVLLSFLEQSAVGEVEQYMQKGELYLTDFLLALLVQQGVCSCEHLQPVESGEKSRFSSRTYYRCEHFKCTREEKSFT